MYRPFGFLNFYTVLGVNRNAPVEEIKEAFRQQALRYHPDKSGSGDTAEEFKKILHAYNVLTDKRQRYIHNQDLWWRQKRDSNWNHPRQEEGDQKQESSQPSLSQRFWSWLLPHIILVSFVRATLWLTKYCRMGFSFACSGSRKCGRRMKQLLIQVWPQVREITTALVKRSLRAFIALSWWSIKGLMAELLRAFVNAPGSPIQKAICVGFAWQIAALGYGLGVWPWVGWLLCYLTHFSLIFFMFGVKFVIYILLNTIPI